MGEVIPNCDAAFNRGLLVAELRLGKGPRKRGEGPAEGNPEDKEAGESGE